MLEFSGRTHCEMMEIMMILEHSIRKQIKKKGSPGAKKQGLQQLLALQKAKMAKRGNATIVHYLAQQ